MKEIDEKIRSFWDEKPCGTTHIPQPVGSREYFTEFDRYYERMYPYLLPFLDLEAMNGKRVLEIGVGSGFTVSRFAKVASLCVGLDISRNTLWLNQARDKHLNIGINLVQATALHIPVVDDTFNMVVSIGCLHHIPDIQQAAAEIYRVLKPGGISKGMVYNRNSYRFRVYIPLVRRLSGRWQGKDWQVCVNEMYDSPDYPYGMVYSKKKMRTLLGCFTKITFQVENYVGEELLHKLGRFVPRGFWLATFGKIAGFDLYFVARALK